jgi:hypothetical protein
MTILSTCRSAALLMSMRQPSSVFSGTDSFGSELGEIANEAAEAILQDYDWRAVTQLATITVNSVDTAFSLPADFERMPKEGTIFPVTSMTWPLARYDNLDDWLRANQTGLTLPTGRWILLGGQLLVRPAPSTNLNFYYITNQVGVRSAAPITSFAQDNDTFVLDERLLKLEIIWRYKAAKGFEYAEDMKNAEKAKDLKNGRERGPTMLKIGTSRSRIDADLAWPGVLG